jgi:hypothetical protein
MNVQVDWLKRELENIRSAIEKLSINAVGMKEFTDCKERVNEAEKAIRALERASERHEAKLKMIASLGGVTLGVLVMLVGAWLKALLGL